MKAQTLFFFLLIVTVTSITGQQLKDRPVSPKAIQQSKKAARILETVMGKPEEGRIPKALLSKAVAVAIVNDVDSIGFVFEGIAKGSGVVTRHFSDGKWSAPAYIFIRAASLRPQLSANSFHVILLFMNEKSADWLLAKKYLEFDRAKAPVAGPVGEIRTEQKEVVPVADVFAYVFDEGRLQGADLKNLLQHVMVSFDNDLNRATYGVTAADILDELHGNKPVRTPVEVMGFSDAVARYCSSE